MCFVFVISVYLWLCPWFLSECWAICLCLRHHLTLKSPPNIFLNKYSLQQIVYNPMIWAFKWFLQTMISIYISRIIINFKILHSVRYTQEHQNQVWVFVPRSKNQFTPTSLYRRKHCFCPWRHSWHCRWRTCDPPLGPLPLLPLKPHVCSISDPLPGYRVYIHFPQVVLYLLQDLEDFAWLV